jgi:hypothetical protein
MTAASGKLLVSVSVGHPNRPAGDVFANPQDYRPLWLEVAR